MKTNKLSKGGAGGGSGSKSLGKPAQYFTGQPSTRISPKGVSQIGSQMGNHSTDSGGRKLTRAVEPVRQGAMGGMGSVPLGNQTALEAGQGPGSGRTTSKCGSQQGVSPAPSIKGRDILSEYGNDSPSVREAMMTDNVKLNPAHGSQADRIAKRLRDSGGGHHEVAKHGDGPQRVIHHIHHGGSQHGGGGVGDSHDPMNPLSPDQEGSE